MSCSFKAHSGKSGKTLLEAGLLCILYHSNLNLIALNSKKKTPSKTSSEIGIKYITNRLIGFEQYFACFAWTRLKRYIYIYMHERRVQSRHPYKNTNLINWIVKIKMMLA